MTGENPPDPAEELLYRTVVLPGASKALHAALSDDWRAATDAVIDLGERGGQQAMAQALLAWIDTALGASGEHDYLDGGAQCAVRLVWVDADSGHTTVNADDIPPATRWAGRLFAARLADDEDTFNALLRALPPDPALVGEHVMAVLTCTVVTIKQQGGA